MVNSIHPGSYHSKITQDGDYATTPGEAAKSVVTTALQPAGQIHPRGQFLLHDLTEVNWVDGMEMGFGQMSR